MPRMLLAPLLLVLAFFESILCYSLIATRLFNCNPLGDYCHGSFFANSYPNSSLIQPYPAVLPWLFFALIIIAVLIPLSSLVLIVLISKKLLMFKLSLYLLIILISGFYSNINGRLPTFRLSCTFLTCESLGESEQQTAKLNNLKVYQPMYLPDSIKNEQKIQRGSYPYKLDYGNNFTILEMTFLKLEDCSVEKNKWMSNGTCEEIKDGVFDARYIYKTSLGSTLTYLTWNQRNTRIFIEFYNDPLPKDEQIKIAKSFK